MSSFTPPEQQITFSWESLTVKTIEETSKSMFGKSTSRPAKTLVDNVSGVVHPGELVALMGASGAGKSTFLNALLFRNSHGLEVSGSRYVNGMLATQDSLTSISAYIEQDDLFIGTMTPREHLTFMASVNMNADIPHSQRMQRVDAVIRELGLMDCQDTLIGIPGRIKSLSGGEKKRLAFAAQVLSNPSLLFCDEPTSGLDSYMATNIVNVLQYIWSI